MAGLRFRSNNPFDSEDFVHISHDSVSQNPFDDLERLAMQPIAPPKLFSQSSGASASSTASHRSNKPRAESKESLLSADIRTTTSSSSDEDEDDDDDDDDEYGPESLSAHPSGKNPALLFMESDAPSRVECRMLIQEDGSKFEFVTASKGQCWMRAQRRKDGLKRLAPSANVSLWLHPALLVAHHKSRGEEEDADVSFSEVMRELERAEIMEGEAAKKDSLLRVGKLRGNTRQTCFNLFGPGKNRKKAVGTMDARPEFMGVKFERGASVLALPGHIKNRPRKQKDFLLRRVDSKSGEPVRKLVMVKSGNMWQYYEESKDADPGVPAIRIVKRSAEEYACDFKDASPAVVFALAMIIHIKGTSLLSAGQSWSSLLPRRSSMRRSSLNGAETIG